MPANVLERLTQEYYRLTASERKVADFVLGHPHDTQYMSISELAEACEVAEATISRFCRRLSFPGYSGFKLALANASQRRDRPVLSGDILPEDSMEEVFQKLRTAHVDALDQTIHLLSPAAVTQAVDLFVQADRVMCAGQGGSMILAMEAAHLFSNVSPKFVAIQGAHRQAMASALLGERDALLLFSYSGATKDMLDTLSIARQRGAHSVLITHYPKSPGAAGSDVVLQCGAAEGPLQMGSVAARIAQLYITDALYQEFCRRDPAAAEANREAVAEALTRKHI
jgi:DNA-binding MurR/RpiR family transcriptional regulator